MSPHAAAPLDGLCRRGQLLRDGQDKTDGLHSHQDTFLSIPVEVSYFVKSQNLNPR